MSTELHFPLCGRPWKPEGNASRDSGALSVICVPISYVTHLGDKKEKNKKDILWMGQKGRVSPAPGFQTISQETQGRQEFPDDCPPHQSEWPGDLGMSQGHVPVCLQASCVVGKCRAEHRAVSSKW